ncbi:MAG: SpoIIIAH-like family protein [Clostridiales bacterium]|nr:SpoIIIAH-like family protein [Clostridiales bacterium]
MIMGKRQIILGALVIALGLAVYLNWSFSEAGNDLTATGLHASSEKNYGDAQYVNGSSLNADDAMSTAASGDDSSAIQTAEGSEYFVSARLTREQSRQEALDVLKDVLKDVKVDEAAQTEAIAASAKIAESIELEAKAENLIKAKGFNDCMVYLDDGKANVVVQAEELVESQVMQIKDIVASTAKISAANITIVQVK